MSDTRIIVKNIPRYITPDRLKSHFIEKGDVIDVDIPKTKSGESRGFAFIGFSTNEHAVDASAYFNNTFLDTCKIIVEVAKPILSVKQTYSRGAGLKDSEKDRHSKAVSESGRIFIRNIPNPCEEQDLKQLCEQFGPLKDLTIPKYPEGTQRGFAIVTYSECKNAVDAYMNLNLKTFLGKIIRVFPGQPLKDCSRLSPKSSQFEQQNEQKKGEKILNEKTWNSLFVNPDAVASYISLKFSTSKGSFLDPESRNLSVKLAVAEAHVIQETIDYFRKNSVNVDVLKIKHSSRSSRILLVKNIPFSCSDKELQSMFERYGTVLQVLLPPSKAIAIVEYSNDGDAKIAMLNLSFKNFKGIPIFLELAPEGLLSASKINTNVAVPGNPSPDINVKTLFVKNLSFSSTKQTLEQHFGHLNGFVSAKVCHRPDPKNPKEILMLGFGFVEFTSNALALKAMDVMQGSTVDGRRLQIYLSNSNTSDTIDCARSSRLLIKNVPFEASKQEIFELFSAFGKVKSVRLPQKANSPNLHKGYAFVDFMTKQEALSAYRGLLNTHIYGRHIIIEWSSDQLDPSDILRKRKCDSISQ